MGVKVCSRGKISPGGEVKKCIQRKRQGEEVPLLPSLFKSEYQTHKGTRGTATHAKRTHTCCASSHEHTLVNVIT